MNLIVLGAILLIWMALVIAGIIFHLNEKKTLGWICISIPLLGLVAFIIYFKSYFHSTNPSSLSIQAVANENTITITGKWQERLERNVFETDYLIFYTPSDTPIKEARFPNAENVMDDYVAFILEQIQDLEVHGTPQFFEVDVVETFQYDITLPEGVQFDDVSIYYMHLLDSFPEPYKWLKQVHP